MLTKTKSGKNLIIRKAKVSDAKLCLDFFKAIVKEEIYFDDIEKAPASVKKEKDYIRKATSGKNYLLIAVVDGMVVGDSSSRRGTLKRNFHVSTIGVAVSKEFRGQGIGRQIMLQMLALLKKNGVKKVVLTVLSTNKRAISLYQKLGFKKEGAQKKHMKIKGNYVDRILMAKFL